MSEKERRVCAGREEIELGPSSVAGLPASTLLLAPQYTISLADYGLLTLANGFLIKQCVKQDGNYSIYLALCFHHNILVVIAE